LQGLKEPELLLKIGQKITDMFRTAFEDAPNDNDLLNTNLRCVVDQALRQTMVGSGTRRLLVSSWVRALQQFRESGLRPISPEEARTVTEGAKQQLEASDARSVESEGE
jgi:hypothetical protein